MSRGRAAAAGDFPGEVDPEFVANSDRVWGELQAELATLSSNSTHVIVPESGHSIPLEAPKRVIDAVVKVRADYEAARL